MTSTTTTTSSHSKRDGFQVGICGGGGVGKSCITVRFVLSIFNDDYDPTIQDAYKKSITVDQVPCDLNLLDTAGQEEYEALQAQFMRECQAYILVYDQTSVDSVHGLERFISSISRANNEEPFPVVLCGNKSDLVVGEGDPEVARAAQRLVSEQLNHCPHFSTSAKNNKNVQVLFESIVREFRRFRDEKERNIQTSKRSGLGGLFGSVSHSDTAKRDLEMFNGSS